MTTVRQILEGKPEVYAVAPDESVYNALKLMAAKNIGAVLVLEGTEIKGIFSERDFARRSVVPELASPQTPVRQMMTPNVICIEPSATADTCMAIMTEKRVRHLPVVEDGRVLGVVSIGDVVRSVVDDQQFTIRSLVSYVTS